MHTQWEYQTINTDFRELCYYAHQWTHAWASESRKVD